jgi:hypothetical protein
MLAADERIGRLTERHEARSHSVELMGHNVAELGEA